MILGPAGRVGCIVPSGIATDDTTKFFFQDLIESGTLTSLYDFQSGPELFDNIAHGAFRFYLLTLAGTQVRQEAGTDFLFFAKQTEDIQERLRHFQLSAQDIALLNPNTRTCPVFQSSRDAEITKSVYRRVPVLAKEGPPEENPWGISFMRMFDMTNDSAIFRTQPLADYVRLYEAKMLWHFDHRFASLIGDALAADRPSRKYKGWYGVKPDDATELVVPQYWIARREVDERLRNCWNRDWLLGWRDICRNTDQRTVIVSILPRVGAGNNAPLILIREKNRNLGGLLAANLSSFVLDFIARFKIGGTHLNFFIMNQLPVLPPNTYRQPCRWALGRDALAGPPSLSDRPRGARDASGRERPEWTQTQEPAGKPMDEAPATLAEWLAPLVLELVYTAWDLEPFAQDCGWSGPPFRWDEERRFLLRCELDAAYFHLYGIVSDDVDYIMETFPIVKRKDEQKYREFRTKRVVLEIYDAMAEATRTGKPYRMLLDPPPADPASPTRHGRFLLADSGKRNILE